MNDKIYSDYVQNFATWTSARAVNRNFIKTSIIKKVLASIDFHNGILILAKRKNLSDTEFDNWHCEISKKLRKELCKHVERDKVSFGRVSKIIAVYIKTVHILNSPYDSLSRFAHIPIDNILLVKLSEHYNDKYFKKIRWTKLDGNQYYELIDKLKEIQKEEKLKYFWMMEKYWVI